MAAAKRLPMIQQRGFLPPQYSEEKILDEKFPGPPKLSAAQDPDMVSAVLDARSDGPCISSP